MTQQTLCLPQKSKQENQHMIGFNQCFISQQICRLQFHLDLQFIHNLHMGIWTAIPLIVSTKEPQQISCA